MATVQFFAFNSSIAQELKARITEQALANPFAKTDGSEWTPSSYQAALFDWIGQGQGSAILKAVAGSGKTTSIIAALSFIRGIAIKDVSCSTFHSVGYRAVLKSLGLAHHQVKVDGGKVRKLAKEMFATDPDTYETYADFIVKLVAFAKGEGIGALVADTNDQWMKLINHHGLSLDSDEAEETVAIEFARCLLNNSNATAKTGDLDFDDQLYLPLLWKLRLWQNDYVFIDEAQDTNPVRRALAKLALKPGGRLVAVGDPRQAIYGFTGASHDAMELIQKEFNCHELPLTVSYRCPKAVADRVRAIVPYFEVPEGAEQGEVRQSTLTQALKVLGNHDAILCRQTAPLISLAFHLIANGRGCKILGREIGQGLIKLIKNMKAKGVDHLIAKLQAFEDREVAIHMAKGEEGKAEAVHDRVECVRTVIDALDENHRTVPALIAKIEGLFSDTNGTLTLSTVHKVKGKEYDNVAILSPELMPSKWARQDWQVEQEKNLQYVAWTRAKKLLIELTTDKIGKEVEG